MYVQRNTKACSCNHFCYGKAVNSTYSEYVFVALGIQHAICCKIFFSRLPHKRQDLKRNVTEHKMCVLNFSTNVVWNICHSKKNWYDMVKTVHWSSCKVPVILVEFLIKLEFLRQVLEKYSNIKFHENPPSGNHFVPCGWTDMRKVIVAFRIFANASKNVRQCDRL